jgi:glycerol-3-phosphate O-acyltransferase
MLTVGIKYPNLVVQHQFFLTNIVQQLVQHQESISRHNLGSWEAGILTLLKLTLCTMLKHASRKSICTKNMTE